VDELMAEWSERFGVAAEFGVSGKEIGRLPADVESHLYRVVQEALHNVAKQARAKHVTVAIDRGRDETMLMIEDDGCGFVASSSGEHHGEHLGLVSMRERATLAGGRLDIESTPGDGTSVFVRIPVIAQELA
jgi:two-component system sensor histidine kinase UhpB